jgi:hypothetical protein
VSAFGRVGVVGQRRIVAHILDRNDRTTLAAAQFVVALVGRNPQQPGAETAAAIGIQAAICRDERLLSGIGGAVLVAHNTERDGVGAVLIAHDQRVEGIEVTAPRQADQRLFVFRVANH